VKEVADVNFKNQKYHFTKIAKIKLKEYYEKLFFNKLHSIDENSKFYLDSKMRKNLLTLIFHSQNIVKTEKSFIRN
jgi:hypothetical protein